MLVALTLNFKLIIFPFMTQVTLFKWLIFYFILIIFPLFILTFSFIQEILTMTLLFHNFVLFANLIAFYRSCFLMLNELQCLIIKVFNAILILN